MNLKTTRASLLAAFKHVSGIVETKSSIPILANVMLTATDGAISIAATDMEIAVSLRVTCDVSAPGSCTAPAMTLYEIARKLPADAEVTLSWKDEKLTLRAGRYLTSLATLPVEDFPAMTAGAFPHTFQIDAKVLASLFARTAFAMSNEETRAYLNGAYLHIAMAGEVPALRICTTDGHRLAYADLPVPNGADGMPGIIIPRKAVGEIAKLLEAEGGGVSVSLSETRVQISAGSTVLTSKLIEGVFPEYLRVIPTKNDISCKVDTKEFASAASRVAVVGDAKGHPISLSLRKDGFLAMAAKSSDRGNASEEIDCELDVGEFEGDKFTIGFNQGYLADILSNIGATTEFKFGTSDSPAVILDPENVSVLFVAMPMRV